MQGKNYKGAPGDIATRNAKTSLSKIKKEPPKIAIGLQCKSLFNVADLVNEMWKEAPEKKKKKRICTWIYVIF